MEIENTEKNILDNKENQENKIKEQKNIKHPLSNIDKTTLSNKEVLNDIENENKNRNVNTTNNNITFSGINNFGVNFNKSLNK